MNLLIQKSRINHLELFVRLISKKHLIGLTGFICKRIWRKLGWKRSGAIGSIFVIQPLHFQFPSMTLHLVLLDIQGVFTREDPLSPFLFNIVMDGFSGFLDKLSLNGLNSSTIKDGGKNYFIFIMRMTPYYFSSMTRMNYIFSMVWSVLNLFQGWERTILKLDLLD